MVEKNVTDRFARRQWRIRQISLSALVVLELLALFVAMPLLSFVDTSMRVALALVLSTRIRSHVLFMAHRCGRAVAFERLDRCQS